MGLTSSLFAGLTGMKSNEFRMDVIGNNIANVNTYAYKSARTSFQTQFFSNFNFGSAPTGNIGGTNPTQVGTGSMIGAVSRDFSGGNPETTGVKTDLAIQGEGMFILEKPDGAQVYSRDGSFQFNAENYLLSSDGHFLQGYGVDSNFNILDGSLGKLRIPIGEITTASTTTEVAFSGALDGDGVAALTDKGDPLAAPVVDPTSNGSVRTILDTIHNQTLTDGGGAISTATQLTDLEVDGAAVFEDGNEILLEKAVKGGQTLPQATFTVDMADTSRDDLGDLLAWFEDVLGINTSSNLPDFDSADPDDGPGVRINATNDGIEVIGNMGTANKLELGNTALRVNKGSAVNDPALALPFTFATANGFTQTDVESKRTSIPAYNSLGSRMNVDVTLVLESKENAGGCTWRFFAESSDVSVDDRVLGTGTITFDGNGQYVNGSNTTITLDTSGSGAVTPQTITLDFSAMEGFAMDTTISMLSQDGFPAGTLQDFSIGADGVIIGSFNNGLTRQLGQVVLATFRNYEGLVADADNLWITGPNSGTPVIKKPQDLGAGSINASALELSNVDLSREFINLIVSSTGFSASSRVIQTSDRLLEELMMMSR